MHGPTIYCHPWLRACRHWHTLMRAKSFIGRPTNALTAYMALIKAGRPPNTDTLSLAHRLVGSVIRALCQRHYKGPNLATALDIALSREVLGPDIPADDAVAALECILAQPQPQTSQGTGQSSGDAASGSTSKGPGGAAFSALLGFGGSASSKLARTRSEPPAVVESNDPDAVPMGVDTPSLAGAADTARARSAHELAAQAQLPGTATAQGNAAGAGAAAGSFTAQLLGGPSQWQSDRASAVSALLSQRSLPAPARRATFTAGAAGTPVRRVRPADALGSLTSPRLRTAGKSPHTTWCKHTHACLVICNVSCMATCLAQGPSYVLNRPAQPASPSAACAQPAGPSAACDICL